MATFVFDGTSNITAAKTDTVVITANPATFTRVADAGGNSVFTFGSRTLTITGTTFGPNADSFPNVSLAGGTFSTAAGNVTATANDLIIAPTGTVTATNVGTASDVTAIFGGLGTSDSIDGVDTINVGGKGSFLVYGNAGNDIISSATNAFDSTSFVTTFAGKGDDTVNYAATTNTGAKFAIYGGEGTDTISVSNTGSSANTFIAGGQGAADSTDAADAIRFSGGGTVNIFGNAGADTINVGGTVNGANSVAGSVDSTAAVTIHGGLDNDTIVVNVGTTTTTVDANNAINGGATAGSIKASIVAYGDEGGDSITVANNAGTTVIYGDTAAADAAGGNDTINFSGQGTATIYAAGGNDIVNLNGRGNADADSTSTITVFGGNGTDTITVTAGSVATANGTVSITAGAGADSIVIGTNANTVATAGTGQTITITDFTTGAGGDTLIVNNNIQDAGATSKFVVDGSQAQTLQQALNLASNVNGSTAGTVGIVAFQGSTYVVVQNANGADFQAGTDLAVKLTGVTDALAASSAITVV